MTALALTALTDFLLAAFTLFLAGRMSARLKDRFSAAWYFAAFLTLLGIAALLGGIDHGFIEPAGLPRYAIQRADWVVLAGVTYCLLMSTVKQFLPERFWRAASAVALFQFAVAVAASLAAGSFLIVILNYAPVMVLLLALNIAGLRKGTGSPWMIAGILAFFLASAIQAAGFDRWSPVDHNVLYHLVSMAGLFLLYRGGSR